MISMYSCRSSTMRDVLRLSWLVADRIRDAYKAAPFSPRAVIVANVFIPKQVLQDEPGVAGSLANAAVGDHRLVRGDALFAVQASQPVHRLQRTIRVRRHAPWHADGAPAVPRTLRDCPA